MLFICVSSVFICGQMTFHGKRQTPELTIWRRTLQKRRAGTKLRHEITNYRIAGSQRDIRPDVACAINAGLDTARNVGGRACGSVMAQRSGLPHFGQFKRVDVETHA